MHLRTRIPLAVVAACLAMADAAGAQSITIAGHETRVTTVPGDQYDPSLSGNLVVFTDYRAADTDVYYVDLEDMTEHLVIAAPGNQELTGISNDLIVYTDYRSADVVLFDRSQGTTRNLTAGDKEDLGRIFTSVDPAISGSLVAWQDTRDGNPEIYAKDVVTGEERRVSDSPDSDSRPSVSGPVTVWQRCVTGGACDIWSYDWSTDVATQVTDTPDCYERNPNISGKKIVYQRQCGGSDNDIAEYDLATGTEERLAIPGEQANPHVSGDFVSYDDQSEGMYRIGLWHPPSGQSFRLTSGTSGQYLNDIDGNRVVYTDDRHGDLEIYMFTFTAEGADTEPPVIWGATDVTVDATSAAGAHVVLSVKATDDLDPSPKLTCTSPVEAVFPIGDTAVTCTATDASGNTSGPATFTVHVRGAIEQLLSLRERVDSLNLGCWIEGSLEAELGVAIWAVQRGHVGFVCIALRVFAHEVTVQTGKAITAGDAASLLGAARRIRAVVGCP